MVLDFSFNKLYSFYQTMLENKQEDIIEENQITEDILKKETKVEENVQTKKQTEEKKKQETKSEKVQDIWQVEIPAINLVAPISEGTSQEVMLEYVGHFEDTSKWNGNIGLAAHNRGYPINYFAKLKDLKMGNEIIYKTKQGTKKYKINSIKTIEDTDWSYLQKTKENKITLITCVANKPNNRLCIQGIEIKEE